jgi:hypothetical protein
LGAAGAKVRKAATFSKRRSAVRTAPRPSAEDDSEETIVAPPVQESRVKAQTPERRVKPGAEAAQQDKSSDFSTRWPGDVRSVAVERELEIARNSYADEHSSAPASDDMPLIWPILTPAERAAAGPARPALKLPFFFALVAGALALAALIAHVKIFAARRDAGAAPAPRTKPVRARRPRPLSDMPGLRKAGLARTPRGAMWPGQGARELAAPSIAMGYAPADLDLTPVMRQQASRRIDKSGPCDLAQDIEVSLRKLLHSWQRVAA